MILSNRTKISLSQFLQMFGIPHINELFDKYDIESISYKSYISYRIKQTDSDKISELVREIISTSCSLNNREYLCNFHDNWGGFEQRLNDLSKCLFLDGYKAVKDKLIKIEPNIEGVIAFDDELTNELRSCGLSSRQDIIDCIENSAKHFRNGEFDSCLSQARVALETLVRKIASEKFGKDGDWQGAISVLEGNALNEKEKWLIKNTYSFISEACHNPLNDEEYARFGRNLAISMCYYLSKKYLTSSQLAFVWSV